LRANRRGIPKEITTARLKRGEVVGRENESGIVIMKWRDKRDVLVLSTRHTDALENTGKKTGVAMMLSNPKRLCTTIMQNKELTSAINYHRINRR